MKVRLKNIREKNEKYSKFVLFQSTIVTGIKYPQLHYWDFFFKMSDEEKYIATIQNFIKIKLGRS